MFQLLKKLLILLFFYLCCIQQAGGNDVHHVNGLAGRNLTVTFTLKDTINSNEKVNMYRDNRKIYMFKLSNITCFSSVNHTDPTICPNKVTQRSISLMFIDLQHSGVYRLSVFRELKYNFEESNDVNLTVYSAEYTTTYTAGPSFNITSFQLEQSEQKSSVAMFVSVLFVVIILMIVLLSLWYWNNRQNTDKTPDVNATSAPQISVPDVTAVEYCVLDFPKRPGEKVRSTEERVEYSPIVFPLRKILAQDTALKSTTQSKIEMTTLQREVKETEKAKTTNPKHHRCPKKNTPCQNRS